MCLVHAHAFFLKLCFVPLDAALVSQKPALDYIKFSWNQMTAIEFEEHCKAKKTTKKADFIHMIQVCVVGPQTVFFDTSRSYSFPAPLQLIPLDHPSCISL